jgi:hypothetical protein
MQITKNFSLLELTSSETAARKGIDNTPSVEVIANLRHLFENVVQPLRDWYGKPISISSAYRSPRLNKAIGGSSTSDHCEGKAVDFTLPKEDYKKVFEYLKGVDKDQLIVEMCTNGYPQWIHVSFRVSGNRNQVLIATKNVLGQTKYLPYTEKDFNRIYFNLM